VLLDTHLLLWALGSPGKLPVAARRLIQQGEVYVSAATIWEIGIKSALGKLTAEPEQVIHALEPAGFLPLPVTGGHAAAVTKLPPLHRDPFDRLLVAQAFAEPMRLLTNDGALADDGDIVAVV
jgi:PIN domain nuclease of toxin-antitoxin system